MGFLGGRFNLTGRGGTPAGSHARRAAEVADIFIPLTRNENSAMTVWGGSVIIWL